MSDLMLPKEISNSYSGFQVCDIVYSGRWSQTFQGTHYHLRSYLFVSDDAGSMSLWKLAATYRIRITIFTTAKNSNTINKFLHSVVRSSVSLPKTFLFPDHQLRRLNAVLHAFGNGTSHTNCVPYSFQILSPTLLVSQCPLHKVIPSPVSVSRHFGGLM